MAWTLDAIIKLAPSDTGLTLKCQLVNSDGTDNGEEITTGFTELAGGEYHWTHDAMPDGFRGFAKFLSGASTYQTSMPINPEDIEKLQGTLDVNAIQISGDAGAADNLEATLDGTGGHLTLNAAGADQPGLKVTSSVAGEPAVEISHSEDASNAVLIINHGDNANALRISGGGTGSDAISLNSEDGRGVTGLMVDLDKIGASANALTNLLNMLNGNGGQLSLKTTGVDVLGLEITSAVSGEPAVAVSHTNPADTAITISTIGAGKTITLDGVDLKQLLNTIDDKADTTHDSLNTINQNTDQLEGRTTTIAEGVVNLQDSINAVAGSGFVEGTDSLEAIAGAINNLNNLGADDIDDRLAEYNPPTKAELDTAINGLDSKLTNIQGVGFNSGADSLKAIRDRGDSAWTTGSGADAEAIRTEIDNNSTQLAAIKAKTDSITTDGISVTLGSNIAADGETLTLVQGEAKLDAINNALMIDVTDSRLPSNVDSDGSVPVLRITGSGASPAFEGTVSSFNDETKTATCKWDITAAQTAALPAGIGNKWELDWKLGGSDTNIITSVIGAPCSVLPQIA